MSEEKNLSNDLIKKMIDVEQKVSAKFLNFLPYNETEFYKSLTPSQQKAYERYIKNKKIKKNATMVILFLSLILVFLLNYDVTGNVVLENLNKNYELFSNFSIIFILLIVGMSIFNFVKLKQTKKKYNKHFDVVEDFIYRR